MEPREIFETMPFALAIDVTNAFFYTTKALERHEKVAILVSIFLLLISCLSQKTRKMFVVCIQKAI